MIPSFTHAMPKTFSPAGIKTSRRGLLIGALGIGAGLAVGFRAPVEALAAETPAAANPLAAYVLIGADNSVTIYSSQFDMGQGSYFGTATLVNEELDADWSMIKVEGAAGNIALYGNVAFGGFAQMTGGSSSTTSSWERYRKAGAAARMMLVSAAAETWGVPAAEITAKAGKLEHASGKSATYGEMAAKAAAMPIPAEIPLKSRADWTQIGNAKVKRYDSKSKTNGTHAFTLDVKLDGLKTAVMIHPPKFGATVASFDAAEAKKVKGVVDVVQVSRGVAVVAGNMWAAIKGREAVKVVWDESKAETRSSSDIIAEYKKQAASAPAVLARNDGDVKAGFASAAKTLEVEFEFPYLAHAAIEPLNAVARKTGDMIEIWGGHQMPDMYQATAAQIAGVTPDKIKLHVMKTGGGFGRRAVFDADVIAEAVEIGKATGWAYPVKVQWTRDNDMKGGRYRPAYVHRLKAGVDKDGKLVAWENHIVGQSIMAGTPFEGMMVTNGVDPTSTEGAMNIPYAIPNVSVGLTSTKTGVPVLWWRAVGSTHTAYAVETFLDEVAEAAGKDPVDLRLSMLADKPRHAAVLRLAAEKAGWNAPPPAGRFRGISLAESFNTIVAQVAEISMDGDTPRIERVVCALDCGVAVNPDQVAAQMEGGIGFGLGAILAEEITLTGGAVDQANYDTYTPLRINQMPKVEVHIVPSDANPTGAGEPGVPPIGPALANAVYAATKKRIRVLPFSKGLTA
jgi:isoquinoline 1-oxidoreductase subunit beta